MKGKERMLDKNNMTSMLEKMTMRQVSENQMSRSELSKKKSLQERGIALIALVVTIIILLILAGVTLNMALSQDGLFSKTQEAADKYKQAQEDEELEIEKIEYAVDGKEITEVETISNKEDFDKFKDDVNEGKKNFENTLIKLTEDLDLAGETWTPIGTKEHPFNGSFNGNGHEIKNLSFGESSDKISLGLFGYNDGIIKNLGVAEGDLTCKLTNESAVIGFITGFNSGIIEHCYNKSNGTFDGGDLVGGIVGYFRTKGSISKCYNEGNLSLDPGKANGLVGGISGSTRDSLTISCCYNSGNITAYSRYNNIRASGISDWQADIESCYNTGDIIATNTKNDTLVANATWPVAGGIIAQSEGNGCSVKNCYSIGNSEVHTESSLWRLGGIAGFVSGVDKDIGNNHYWISPSLEDSSLDLMQPDKYKEKIKGYTDKNDLKGLASLLGKDFKEDTSGKINGGFPILTWQDE